MSICKITLKSISKGQYHPAAVKSMFGSQKVQPCLTFSRSQFFQQSRNKVKGMSISGVQQKLSVKIDKDTHTLHPTVKDGEFILKPSPETYPNAAENEHCAMLVSKIFGIKTAECGLVPFSDGELVYITKRFDRDLKGNKHHQEDLMQCLGMPAGEKYDLTYEEVGKLLLDITNHKKSVVLDFIKRIMFAYLIGNDDLHLKNLSVKRHPDSTRHSFDELTLNYDVLFCDALRPFEDQNKGLSLMALGLLHDQEEGKGEEYFSEKYAYYGLYTGFDFLELADRLTIPNAPIIKIYKTFTDKIDKAFDLINRSFMPDEMKKSAKEMMKNRLRLLGEGLNT